MSSAGSLTQDHRIGRLTTDLGKDMLLLRSLIAEERLSESFTVTIEAVSAEPQPIHTLLGTMASVSFVSGNPTLPRDFAGVVWEYTELGREQRLHRYRLVLRPDVAFMTLNRRNRIFQNKSSIDIVKSLLAGSFKLDVNGSYDPLEYCVQYQESDFAFMSRLLEYDGIYYYYAHSAGACQLVLVDNANAHPDLAPATAQVLPKSQGRGAAAPVWSLTERRTLGPAKVTVADYDFEAPDTQLLKSKAAAKVMGAPSGRDGKSAEGSAGSWSADAEIYDFPGKYTSKTTARGEHYGAMWLDAHRNRMARSFAEGTLFAAAVGRRVTLSFQDGSSTEYLIVATRHDYDGPDYATGAGEETFLCSMELMPAADQYRPALSTPRPRVLGPQTAIVVGPSGEEIHTDKYGRIKVQFFWDREGKKDENAGCFVRVMQSGAGQGWGSFALPRIGQEVVVEFLDGDPDRPLVTGAVYNAKNTVPEALPANMTQFGLKTRSTKGGGGYNRLWFEDKKDSEVVWFRAEKDYKANIVNKDEERQYDKGNRKTTFMEGNDELIISKGTRTETIESHDKKTIKTGNLTDTVETGDETHTVKTGKRTTAINGDEALEVKTGNRTTAVKMGNDSHKVSLGNIDVKADLGKVTIEAMQSIELKVGGSSIKIDQIGVTIQGTVKVDIKGVMIQSSADAMQIIKGGLVMIN